jgi:hypothetical protein
MVGAMTGGWSGYTGTVTASAAERAGPVTTEPHMLAAIGVAAGCLAVDGFAG